MPNSQQKTWDDLPDPDWIHLFYPQKNYLYFRQPLPIPDAASAGASGWCTPRAAACMADAAMLAYGRSGPDLIPPIDFNNILQRAGLDVHLIGDWSGTAKGTQGYFAFNDRLAILAFRGTEKSDWTDSLVDLTVLPVKEDWSAIPSTGADKTLHFFPRSRAVANPLNAAEIAVHAGFQFALNAVWGDVSNWLGSYHAKNPASPIYFTGHSLGAALATLAIARYGGGNAALYTFGSPRAGNKAFCDQVKTKATLGIFRFVDKSDLVTMVPPKDLFYDHTSGLSHIDDNGNITTGGAPQDAGLSAIIEILAVAGKAALDYTSQAPPPPQLVDHSPSRYCYYIWNWAK